MNFLSIDSTTFSACGNYFNIPTSEIIYLFDKFVFYEPITKFPDIISFDEKFTNSKLGTNGYNFVIADFSKVTILDMLQSRHKSVLIKYFNHFDDKIRNKVKFITMDMNYTYRDIAKMFFPNAKIAIDSFHVIRNIKDVLNDIRIKVMKRYENEKEYKNKAFGLYSLFKNNYSLLFKSEGDLKLEPKYYRSIAMKISQKTVVRYMLELDNELKEIYGLYQHYLEFNLNKNKTNAKEEIEDIINSFICSTSKPIPELGEMLLSWEEYILNSFIRVMDPYKKYHRRLSNGPIEGLNKRIKKIHNNGNGYDNFKRFKTLCMFKINKNHVNRQNKKEFTTKR